MFHQNFKNQRKVIQHIPRRVHVSKRDIPFKTRVTHNEVFLKEMRDTRNSRKLSIDYFTKLESMSKYDGPIVIGKKYPNGYIVSNSMKNLDTYTIQDIYKYFDLTTQFKFSSTCEQHYILKITLTSLVVDDYMTDVSLSGLSGITYVDCDRNVFLTDNCFKHIPNVTHFCCGFNTNFTHKIFSNLPKMTLLECDDNEHMIKKNTYDMYANNSDGPRNVFYYNRIQDELSTLYDYVMKDMRCSYYTRRDNPSIMLRISCNPSQRFSSDGKIIVEWKHRKNTADYKQWLKNIRTFELIKTIDSLHYDRPHTWFKMDNGNHSNSPLSIWLEEHPQHDDVHSYKILPTQHDHTEELFRAMRYGSRYMMVHYENITGYLEPCNYSHYVGTFATIYPRPHVNTISISDHDSEFMINAFREMEDVD